MSYKDPEARGLDGGPPACMSDRDPALPERCFHRGDRIWCRIKDERSKWVNEKTPYVRGQNAQAERYVKERLQGVSAVKNAVPGSATVAAYLEQWLTDRETRGIAGRERARFEKHVIPFLGALGMTDVKPVHVRDLVRSLRALSGEEVLAPRTIIHIYHHLHNAFRSAVVEQVLTTNPIIVDRVELPRKVDADREWRKRANFTVAEVEQLLTSPLIPVMRRVMYALKALPGMRHGEAAAICWRHRDETLEPYSALNIVQAYDSEAGEVKDTKTEDTRSVPELPVLTKILDAWRDVHWPRIYGRKPTEDDFIVPARTGGCISAGDAGAAIKLDLAALGLRVEAGKRKKRCRDRGGHDLRSWYKTRTIEDGAEGIVIRRTTHAPPKDVDSGYERFSWATTCREVGKLRIAIADEDVLKIVPESLDLEKKAAARWELAVRTQSPFEAQVTPKLENQRGSEPRRFIGVTSLATGTAMLERAIRAGDMPRALEITRQLRALEEPSHA